MQESAAPVLRPLGIGDIVDRMITLYRGSPLLFGALALLPYLVFELISALVGVTVFFGMSSGLNNAGRVLNDPRSATSGQIASLVGSAVVVAIIVIIVSLVVVSVQAAAIVDATAKRYLGTSATIGGSLRNGLRASGRLVVAYLLAVLLLVVVCSLFAGGLFVLGFLVNRTPALVALITFVGVVALFVGVFYFTASFMVMPAVVTVEGAGPVHALRRSWTLSNGYRWRILGLLLLLFVIVAVLSGLLSFVVLIGVSNQGPLQFALQQVVGLLITALWTPLEWGVFTILYYDLRVRKEAFDLQLAAEALPRDT
ncbi:MAG TPA: hypothetical protein VF998_10745 [Candidatus Limnocylindria bacterium]